ncbi:MAG: aminotransferase class I/II-fold pyridoxal phosphate-dependent enzyme [Lautropia sp.]|nr:aminotransferase class I/II-fold pyridoxal phosphate-dependent enzyme [Lautropia sp.]
MACGTAYWRWGQLVSLNFLAGKFELKYVNQGGLRVRSYRSVNELPDDWNEALPIPTPMKREFLDALESSEINNIGTYYLRVTDQDGNVLAQANVFVSETDFSTFDTTLPASARSTIKRWIPGFMSFRIVEVGYFTMIGEGVAIAEGADLSCVLPAIDKELQEIADKEEADFVLVRDVPESSYESYLSALAVLGYSPSIGFPNTLLPVKWRRFEDYLADINSKTRLKFRNSLKIQERFDVEWKIVDDFRSMTGDLSRLWDNVNKKAKDYTREKLDQRFFDACSDKLADQCEVITFFHAGRMIAFMLNMIGGDDYIVLDWGVDYSFEHYRQANLYRAATLISLQRAIELGKSKMELGITNYTPKLTLGAEVVPLAYFIRHRIDKRYGRTLARLVTDSINLPDTSLHATAGKIGTRVHDMLAFEQRVKRDQNPFGASDILDRVGSYNRSSSMRLSGIYGLYPEFNSAQRSVVTFSDSRERVLLGTNSYLGLADDPRVISAAVDALHRYGSGCSGSPLLNGTLDIHKQLEEELAIFSGREAVALCSTGYQTNLAAISALCGRGDVVLMDARNHRSLFDGVRLSGADCVIYRHADMAHLERLLARTKGRKRMIITDSVFSMEGTIADLQTLVGLASAHDARVFVDESHAVGVFGCHGRGIAELQGVEDRVDIVMGTFSKAFAGLGGFVAGSADLIDYIKHNAGGHIFSASLPPSVVATVLASLDIIRKEPERRQAPLDRAKFMALELQAIGYDAPYHGSQIVPVILGNYTLALSAYKRFMDEGVYVNPVGPPAVPESSSGFRTSYIATHGWDDLKVAVEVFRRHYRDFYETVNREEDEHAA